MKFEYDGVTDRGECVAYIDCGGDLKIKVDNELGYDCAVICPEGDVFQSGGFDPNEYGVRKLFYPGDKITITF